MKCDQATTWLLMSDSPGTPPAAVDRHLDGCPDCRATQRQLVALENRLGVAPVPAESTTAKRRFLAKLSALPAHGKTSPRKSHWPRSQLRQWRWMPAFALATAAALMIAFVSGWLLRSTRFQGGDDDRQLSREPESSRVERAREIAVVDNAGSAPPAEPFADQRPRATLSDRGLTDLRPFIENHIQLALAENPSDRLVLLADLAENLWREAARQARQGPTEELLLLSRMYERVVARGLPASARTLSAEDEQVRGQIVMRLKKTQLDAAQAADASLPVVDEILTRIGVASSDAARQIEAGQEAEPVSSAEVSAPPQSSNLLASLVGTNLKLANEDDPLRRAEYCSDLADDLSQRIVLLSLDGDEHRAAELGEYLGDVVDRGVTTNLDRFHPTGPDDPRWMEYDRIKQHSPHSLDVLQRNLERAPEPAKKGLMRAIEAQQRGRGKPKEHGHPSPPGRSPDFIPPGLKKSLSPIDR